MVTVVVKIQARFSELSPSAHLQTPGLLFKFLRFSEVSGYPQDYKFLQILAQDEGYFIEKRRHGTESRCKAKHPQCHDSEENTDTERK